MTDAADWVTYDGLPISSDRPSVAVVVVSRTEGGADPRYLLLHRAHHGPDFAGDWAWTPPAGARFPGEDITATAARELREETGLVAVPLPVLVDDVDCAILRLNIDPEATVVIDGTEHDRMEWVSFDEACRRCLPSVVVEQLRAARDDAATD